MKDIWLFVLMSIMGGLGGALGSMAGNAFGRGGVIGGGLLGGILLVVSAAYMATGWGWCKPKERRWVAVGGVLGFALAALVTLSTLSSPIGPILSTLLIGTGALLGTRIGRSAHDRHDA